MLQFRIVSYHTVLSYYEGDNLFPLRGRSCSSQQMPFIKKKFETYDAFGKASLVDVYGAENLDQATSYSANTFESAYFENTGQGHFKFHPLPKQAQISSINDILSESTAAEAANTKADDPLFYFFTSGTTGLPKVVVHTHLTTAFLQNRDSLHT